MTPLLIRLAENRNVSHVSVVHNLVFIADLHISLKF
jgi:Na+/H+ antiporter NhaD/arsenite permease-like protein